MEIIDFFVQTKTFWLTLTGSMLSAVIVYAVKTYASIKKREAEENRYLHYLLISHGHASEKTVPGWKDEQTKKFDELNQRKQFIHSV